MPSTTAFALFLPAALALLLIPGPAVVYIVTRGVDQGRVAGVVAALGMATGTCFHVIAAVVGLSALLVSSAVAFTFVKLAGAGYLIFIGVRRLVARGAAFAVEARPHASLARIYRESVVINILNPKTALFFLAFLPQFVDAEAGATSTQIAVLGMTFVLLGVVTDGAYGVVSGSLGGLLRESKVFMKVQRNVSGGVYVVLGLAALATRRVAAAE